MNNRTAGHLVGLVAVLVFLIPIVGYLSSGSDDTSTETANEQSNPESLASTEVSEAVEEQSEPAEEAPPPSLVTYTEDREACTNQNPQRNAYFGDLHVHTAYSFDAFSNGTRSLPADALAFARGKEIGFPPYDEEGNPAVTAKIDRPLDFMAVTDHSETLGEMHQCTESDQPGYESEACKTSRVPGPQAFLHFSPMITEAEPKRLAEVCGEDGSWCIEGAKTRWAKIREETEKAYDRTSACAFTAFHGYEYTGTTNTSNLHRNVVFRNDSVPDYAVSYLEAPKPYMLWERLKSDCLDGIDGCDVLAIPHNSNLSNGKMFSAIELGDQNAEVERAALRVATEPLVEIFQHKANSECTNGLLFGVIGEPDELCEIEQVRKVGRPYNFAVADNLSQGTVTDCKGETGEFGMINGGCVAATDFVRGALLLGLQEQQRLGVNPFEFGIIGSTDTHLANPGDVKEETWKGHIGYETTLPARIAATGFMPTNRYGNPGGLAGVWAIENSRDAIFNALENRESFGTSGPRIAPRFFGGWEYPANACSRGDMIAMGYEAGVPMGGTLPDSGDNGGSPIFIASALRDPADSAQKLERLQVIKGWIDAGGTARYKTFDVAGQQGSDGSDSLCTVFTDPEFDAAQPAYYYLRAAEVPTKRWDTAQCEAAGADAPAMCADIGANYIQEMAWSSPIWYKPN